MIWEEWPRVCGHRTLPSLSYAERGNPSQQADGQEAERAGVSWGGARSFWICGCFRGEAPTAPSAAVTARKYTPCDCGPVIRPCAMSRTHSFVDMDMATDGRWLQRFTGNESRCNAQRARRKRYSSGSAGARWLRVDNQPRMSVLDSIGRRDCAS